MSLLQTLNRKFDKFLGGAAVAEPPAPPAPQPEPEPEQPEIAPYGETFNGLTRFGTQWIPLNEMLRVGFDPADGCGAEVWIPIGNQCYTIHLEDDEAAALKQYMMSHAAVTAAAEGR